MIFQRQMVRAKYVAAPNTIGEGKGRLVRRLAHGFISLGLVYYLLPDPLPVSELPKWLILLVAAAAVILIESIRLKKRKLLTGMRPHEARRIASYTYAVIGLVAVLFYAPVEVGAPCIIAMAWTDPIAGEIRLARRSEILTALISGVSYASISLLTLLSIGVQPLSSLLLISVTTPIAIASESLNIGGLDDDFTMLVFPSLGGVLVWIFAIG